MFPNIYLILPSYGVMATIGLCVSMLFLYIRIEEVDMTLNHFLLYLKVGGVCLLAGSRILFVIGILPSLENISISVIGHYFLNGGIVFYGGMLGFVFGIIIVAKCRKESSYKMLNFLAPAIPLFHGFARIGCLLAGCCYGIPCDFGVRMLQSPDVIRFPVQLLESFCDFIIFIGILIYKKKGNSYAIEVYLISYAICRFVLEFFRGDNIRGLWMGGISTSQMISILIIGVVCVLRCKREYFCNTADEKKVEQNS